ncbi:MAG: C-terminal target protein [Bacteroidota bacterium]|nr:C-terminal target protein [Bacteroidota bacterium]
MRKTFTFLLLLSASIIFLPEFSKASSTLEVLKYDAKYGDKDLIKFYPNPMITDANIRISEDVDLDRSKVTVVFYNIVGSEVYRINQVKEYDQKITRDVFKNSGIYFYQLMVDEKVTTTGRITVK